MAPMVSVLADVLAYIKYDLLMQRILCAECFKTIINVVFYEVTSVLGHFRGIFVGYTSGI